MSRPPVVSVVVPYFDSAEHIEACIESLLRQEDPGGDYELLFIDNGSSDGSEAIVARHPRVVALAEPAPGAYAARNKGIGRARAPVIAFTDADCAVSPGWLRTIVDGMKEPTTDVLLGRCLYPPHASVALRALAAYENAKTDYVLRRCPKGYHYGYCNNMAVRARVFETLGPFEPWKRAADSELVHRLEHAREGAGVRYEPAMTVTHREFVRFRDRARRLSLYTETNARIPTFRELSRRQRLAVVLHALGGGGAVEG